MCDPLGSPQLAAEMAAKGVSLFALELLPRITRAQSMDVLSSQATIAGYRAVLLAADAIAQNVPHDDHGRRHAQRREGVRRSARAWPVCRPSPRPAAWARPCRPTTFARPSRSRCRASGASSSRCRWRPLRRNQGRIRPGDGRGILPQAAGTDVQGGGRAAMSSSPRRPFPARNRPSWSPPRWSPAWRRAR